MLSRCYYEMGDFNKALEYNHKEQEEIKRKFSQTTLVSGDPMIAPESNEVSFLMALEEYGRAKEIVNDLDVRLEKLRGSSNHKEYVEEFNTLIMLPHKAKLAIEDRDLNLAEKIISELQDNISARPSLKELIQILKAECEMQEGKRESALQRANEVLQNSSSVTLKARAEKIKMQNK